jgi:hypothetical protein
MFLEPCLDSLLRPTPAGASLQIVFNATPTAVRERTIEQASACEGPTSFTSVAPRPVVVTTFARRIADDAFKPTLGSNKDLGPTTIDEWRRWHESGRPFELLWPGAVSPNRGTPRHWRFRSEIQ